MAEEKDTKSNKGESNEEESMAQKVKELLEKNPEGLTADEIALKLGVYSKEDSPSKKRARLKKIRIYARRAIAGVAAKKKGRSAIYQLDPSVESPQAEEEEEKAPPKKEAKEEPKPPVGETRKEGGKPKKPKKKPKVKT